MSKCSPLVVTEVIKDNEEHLLSFIQQREHLGLEDVGRQRRGSLTLLANPVQVVLLDELREAVVGLLLLHLQHLHHTTVGAAQLQLPVHQALVHIYPVVPRAAVGYLHGYLLEVLLVLALRNLRLDGLTVDVLLERQENLVGVHGLDEVVGYLLSDGLLHDVLLLALGNHHHGYRGINLLELAQGFQSADTRHLLVEQHEVEVALTAQVEGIGTVAYGHDFIAFLLKEHDVALELLNLVVYPE